MDQHLFEDSRGLTCIREVYALEIALRRSRRLAAYMALNLIASIEGRTRALAAIVRLFEGDARTNCARAARQVADVAARLERVATEENAFRDLALRTDVERSEKHAALATAESEQARLRGEVERLTFWVGSSMAPCHSRSRS